MNRKVKELNRENNRLDEEIWEENQEIFTDMICYLRGSELSEYNIEVVRHDLTEMVIAAQERGEDIEKVIGGDYQNFCDEVIATFPKKTVKQKLISSLDMICLGLAILSVINILISKDTIRMIQYFIAGKDIDFNIAVSLGTVFSAVFIISLAYMMVKIIMKNAFRKDLKHKKIVDFIASAVYGIILIAIAWVGRNTLFTVNIFAAIAVTVALFAGHKILEAFYS